MTELPPPLVAPDADIRDFAFMPLDVARLRDSDLASNETPEACWAAVLLWCASWHQIPAGSIPDDDRWIAKQAGYAQRGKIAKEWPEVRVGALRNWIKCSDGRLYHPVVAEKANDAWNAKRRQRWVTECARIKKYNQRNGTAVPCPSFDEWLSLDCPSGQGVFVPRDEGDGPTDNSGDNGSKGQGEGQRQGQGLPSKPSGPDEMPAGWLAGLSVDLVERIRAAVGPEPCGNHPDFAAIAACLADGCTEADVLEGITEGLRKASAKGERVHHWTFFAGSTGFIRKARDGRLAGPRKANGHGADPQYRSPSKRPMGDLEIKAMLDRRRAEKQEVNHG